MPAVSGPLKRSGEQPGSARAGWGLVALFGVLAACAPEPPAERFVRAEAQFQEGNYRVAAIELRNVLQQLPDHLDARVLLARVSVELGDFDVAAAEFTRAASLGAELGEFAITHSAALIQTGRPRQALEILDNVSSDRRDGDWWTARGEAQLALGETAAAYAAFLQAMGDDAEEELAAESYRALVGLAAAAEAGGSLDEAHARASRAIALDPGRAEAWLVRGRVHLRSLNLAAAEQDLKQAAQRMTDRVVTQREAANLFALGQLQLTLGRFDELEETVALARTRAPGSAVSHYLDGVALHARGRYREADVSLQSAVAEVPDNPQARVMLGMNSLRLLNLGQAEQQLLAALNLQPGDSLAARLLAETRRRQGRPQAALEALRQARGSDSDPALLALRGVLHVEAGEPQQGVPLLERAAQILPGDIGLQLQLARGYLAVDRPVDASGLFSSSLGEATGRVVEVATGLFAGAVDADAARTRARELLALEPDDIDVRVGVALFLYAAGDRDNARVELERAVQSNPAHVAAQLALAGVARASGDLVQARSAYQSVVTHSSEEFRGWLGLAGIAAIEQAMDEALGFAGTAAEVAPNELAPLLLLGQLNLAVGDAAAARAASDRALALAPDSGPALMLSGLVALEQEESERGLADLRAATDRQLGRADYWYALARAERDAGNLQASANALGRAVELAPGVPSLRIELAQAEYRAGNLDAARRVAQRLQADFPNLPDGYAIEAAVVFESGDPERAVPLYDQAYSIDPSFELALASHRAHRLAGLENAARPLERWLMSAPDDGRAWLLLADYHQATGSAGPALEAYERVIDLEAENVVALNNAAWLLNEGGGERALDYARRAHELAPEAPPVLNTYGWVLLHRGAVDDALVFLRRAANGAPDAADIQYHLAFGLAQAGERDEARALLQRILAEGGEFSNREKALTLLDAL